jgi:hypothetical protein
MASLGVPAVLDDDTFPSIARIVFHELAESRRNLHAARAALPCDASFRFISGFRVSGDCPCVDEYLEALVEVCRFLQRQGSSGIGNVSALTRTHLRLRVVKDLNRRRRAGRTQQRTDRLEHGAIGRALATPDQKALLRHLVEEAGSDSPLDSDTQLVRRLARRRADEFGGTADDHIDGVRRDLPVVRQAAIIHGRRQRDSADVLVSWWERYVETGLGRRERLSTVPITTATPDGEQVGTPALDLADSLAGEPFEAVLQAHAISEATGRPVSGPDPELAVVSMLVDAVATAATALQARAAVRAALSALGCAEAVPGTRIEVLLGDPAALDAVVCAAGDLAPISGSRVPA